jgi:hypothetical protein
MKHPTAALVMWVLLGPVTTSAHHSFAAEYDANQPVSLQGQIVRLELVNPHSWLYVEVKSADGKAVRWTVEMGAPNMLIRRGLSETTLPIGETVTIDGYRARDGSTNVSGRQIRLPDGRTRFAGSSNSVAPGDK